jgi:hypothetical protein
VLTKRTSDLAGAVTFVFEKTEGQGISEVITLGGFILAFVILRLVILRLVRLRLVILRLVRLRLVILRLVRLVISIFLIPTRRDWSALLGSGRRVTDFGFTNKNRAGLDGDRACLDVANHFGTAFDFNSLSASNITVNLPVNDDRLG